MNPIVISSDDIKRTIQGYSDNKAEEFHKESVKKADKEFGNTVKLVTIEKKVILMSGGSASGKTEFISEHLRTFKGIVFDGTLSSTEGAKIKIKKILKVGKLPSIYLVLPDSLIRAFAAFYTETDALMTVIFTALIRDLAKQYYG